MDTHALLGLTARPQTRVIVIDDEQTNRELLKVFFEAVSIKVVAEGTDGTQAHTLARSHDADVILMDYRMPFMDGATATRNVREAKGPPVLILTSDDSDDSVTRCVSAGAAGVITRSNDWTLLHDAIRSVAEGTPIIDPRVTRRIPRINPEARTALRNDERTLLAAVLANRSNNRIAETLKISASSIGRRVREIFAKVGHRRGPQWT